MNKAEIVGLIYAERESIADEQERAEGNDLALLEGWEKALVWILKQIESEREQVREITEKEYGTIIYALEEYQGVLEKEGDIPTRNYVMDLIHKVCDIKGESK